MRPANTQNLHIPRVKEPFGSGWVFPVGCVVCPPQHPALCEVSVRLGGRTSRKHVGDGTVTSKLCDSDSCGSSEFGKWRGCYRRS